MNNNSKLTAAFQAATGQTKVQAEENIRTVLTAIQNLAATEKVTIQGYGSFYTKHKRACTARNPRTGDSIAVPAKDVFMFKVSK